MLKLDLARLEREKKVRVEVEIPSDDPLWEGSGLAFLGPVGIDLTAALAGGEAIVVRGWVEGTLGLECRRCLDPVELPVKRDLTLIWTPADKLGPGEDDGDSRVVDVSAVELDLGDAIREELILGTDQYVVCDPKCRGLCPRCGTNLNVERCECVLEEQDPRWDVLRTLMTDG